MSNFGIGLGSFMSGFAQGANTGLAIKRGLRAEEQAEAQEARAAETHDWRRQQMTRTLAEQERTDAEAAATRAANQGAATAAIGARDADIAAGNTPKSLTDYWFQQADGIVADHLKNGRADQATKLTELIRDSGTRRGVEAMERAAKSYYAKDMDGLIRGVNEARETPAFANVVPKILSYRQLEGKDGQPGNVEFTFQRDGSDETYTDDYSLGEIQGLLLSGASPGAALKRLEEQAKNTERLRLETSKGVIQENREIAKEGRANAENDRRAGRDQNNRLEAQNNASWLREAERKAAADLRLSPDVARKQVADAQRALAASDPRFTDRTPEQQRDLILQYLKNQDDLTAARNGQTGGGAQSRGITPPLQFGR